MGKKGLASGEGKKKKKKEQATQSHDEDEPQEEEPQKPTLEDLEKDIALLREKGMNFNGGSVLQSNNIGFLNLTKSFNFPNISEKLGIKCSGTLFFYKHTGKSGRGSICKISFLP